MQRKAAFESFESGDEQPPAQAHPRSARKANSRGPLGKSTAIPVEEEQLYDYDAYVEKKQALTMLKKPIASHQQPKYIHNIMEAAAKRKLEKQVLLERKLLKEREAEGGQFKDKEIFVTSAYKKKQEEIKRQEEADKQTLSSKGVGAFYRDLLERNAPVIDVSSVPDIPKDMLVEEDNSKKMKRLIENGALQVNDSEEVIDKRQLLSAGLNITEKKIISNSSAQSALEKDAKKQSYNPQAKRKQRELIHDQYQRSEREVQVEKQEKLVKVAKILQKKATAETISDARARFLARKKSKAKDSSDSE